MTKEIYQNLKDRANELRKEYDVTIDDMEWVIREYLAFNTVSEMRGKEVNYFSDKMKRVFAKLLANDGGETVYIAENENPPILSTYSHLKDILSKEELHKLKAATEEDIYKFLL